MNHPDNYKKEREALSFILKNCKGFEWWNLRRWGVYWGIYFGEGLFWTYRAIQHPSDAGTPFVLRKPCLIPELHGATSVNFFIPHHLSGYFSASERHGYYENGHCHVYVESDMQDNKLEKVLNDLYDLRLLIWDTQLEMRN